MKCKYILCICITLLLIISAAGILFADILSSFKGLKPQDTIIGKLLTSTSIGQADISRMPQYIPDPNIDYKILSMKIDPTINYTILNALRPKVPQKTENRFRNRPEPPSLMLPKLWHKPYNLTEPQSQGKTVIPEN